MRLGGISGLLFMVLFVPSYLSAPDTPIATSGPQEVIDYFTDRQDGILFINGLLLIFAAFFFLGFLGVLHSVLQDAEGERYGFSSVSLAGGLLFITLVLAGAAVEIVYPATLARFEKRPAGCSARLPLPGALWLDVSLHFCRHGSADSRGFSDGAEDGSPARMAGLGWFRSSSGGAAAFPGPARWLVGAALGNSGLCADTYRRRRVYWRSAHAYRAHFLVGTRTDAPHSPSCREGKSPRKLMYTNGEGAMK